MGRGTWAKTGGCGGLGGRGPWPGNRPARGYLSAPAYGGGQVRLLTWCTSPQGTPRGGVVLADGVFVRPFEQAVHLAVGVVGQLDLANAEPVGPGVAGVLGDLREGLGGQLQLLVKVHEQCHVVLLPCGGWVLWPASQRASESSSWWPARK